MTDRAGRYAPRELDLPCRVAVERTSDYLAGHVVLGQRKMPEPGDSVHVQGEEIQAPQDSRFIVRRRARLRRANPITRLWTKIIAIFEITELLETSFSGRRKL